MVTAAMKLKDTPWKKSYDHLDSILKSRDITLPTKVHLVQLSHPYMTTGKTIALTRQIFVSKVMSLLLNMLARFVIAFLPRSKSFSFSSKQQASFDFMAAVTIICSDIGAQESKICHCFHFSPIYLQ